MTLGDFTNDKSAAVSIYMKALEYAEQANLTEYIASIKLVIAENYFEMGNHKSAINLATEADETARLTSDIELRKEISEFLLQLSKST